MRKASKLLRWTQKRPQRLFYLQFDNDHDHLRIISDAAFKREPEDGYSLRGALFLRCNSDNHNAKRAHSHVIEWVSKSQKHVCRSAFSAELLGACDSVDRGVLISQMTCEVRHGRSSASEMRNLRNQGGFAPTSLHIDAKSVFSALSATFNKDSSGLLSTNPSTLP